MSGWLLPKEYVGSVREIDPQRLLEIGINAVLIDLDNTLVEWTSSELEPQVEDWVREALWAGVKVCIVSNTDREARIAAIAKRLGIPYVLRAQKPRRGAFRRAMDLLGVGTATTAIIGDQVFTDVIGGNRLGAYTILCVPMPGREYPGMRMVRSLECTLLRHFVRKGRLTEPESLLRNRPPANTRRDSSRSPTR